MAVPTVPQITSPADGASVSGVVSVEWSESVLQYLLDTFDRADSSTTLGTADSGQSYTVQQGTWGISSNKAYSVSDADKDIAHIPSGLADGDGTFEVDSSNDVTSGSTYRLATLAFRYIDGSNYLMVDLYNNTVRLIKLDGGSASVLASAAVTLVSGTTYTIKVTASGADIEVFVDGVSEITHTLSAADQTQFGGATKVALRLAKLGSPTTSARWDNLTVTG